MYNIYIALSMCVESFDLCLGQKELVYWSYDQCQFKDPLKLCFSQEKDDYKAIRAQHLNYMFDLFRNINFMSNINYVNYIHIGC